MPKIIDDLKQKILFQANDVLLKEGYGGLTIRRIAKSCDVAVGTVYNYFSSKDRLVAEVVLEDWKNTLQEMNKACNQAPDVQSGLFAIYKSIRAFASLYTNTWEQYTIRPEAQSKYRAHRKTLCNQITEIVNALLYRFCITDDPYLPTFTAQMLLTVSVDETFAFSDLNKIIHKLYDEKGKTNEQLPGPAHR